MGRRTRSRARVVVSFGCTAFLSFAALPVAAAPEVAPADLEHFETRIRPVLAEHCYRCHGGKRTRAGLVLLDAESLRTGGDRGPAVVPGSPDQSLLIQAIRYDGRLQMPPDGRLPQSVIADFERWVRRGAADPRDRAASPSTDSRSRAASFDYTVGREHWAFRRIADPQPPRVEREDWVRQPLDRFVLAGLEKAGLEPVEPADKRTLLRRVSFDLVGLPPTEDEIEAFLADTDPGAFARVVDRLLASPRYGERWGRHWLDLARYADSNGLDENIAHRNAFRYRDYVIDSFNEDKPYDRFVREQIAGDLMPATSDEQRFEQLTGTGFLLMGPKVLAEQDVDKMVIDIVDEQLHTLGRAFLGLPIGCARCHDHKFDPIPTADYYALAGILRSTRTMSDAAGMRWVERPVTSQTAVEAYEAAQEKIREAEKRVEEVSDEENERLRRVRRQSLASYLLAAEEAYPASLPLLRAAGDRAGEGHADEDEPAPPAPPIVVSARGAGLEATVLERVVRALYRTREEPGPEGDAANPFLAFEIWNAYAAAPPERFEEVTRTLRARIASEKVLVPPLTRSLLRGPAPRSLAEVARRYDALLLTVEIAWDQHLQRLAVRDDEELSRGDFRLPREQEELRALTYGDAHGGRFCVLCLPSEQEEALYPPEALAELEARRATVAELKRASPPEPPFVMAVEEGDVADLPVHVRGSHLSLSDTAEPRGFLKVTDHLVSPPPIAADTSGRLELARWITHPEHPLTARVVVNRIWHHLFGRGLVDTPSNFGTTGSRPSHPELLDFLARRFVAGGWSIKSLQREILLSSTYRLSSAYDADNAAVDEQNRLLWRKNRRRLEAEPIRDAMLQLAGRLDLTMGGRVEEYDPRGYVFDEGSTFGESHGFYEAPRRSVYLPVVRNAIYEVLAGFDFGDASDSVGRRARTIVPSQALLMMNSPFVERQALGFAEQLFAAADTPEKRVRTAFLRAYGRPATAVEIDEAVEMVEAMRGEARQRDKSYESEHEYELAAADEELYAWARLCQVILAASEMIYVS